MAKTKPHIECKEDGPYVVTGLEDFKNSKGEPVAVKPVMALCRCGGSERKPFCDGTHTQIGFKGEKRPDRTPDRRDDYVGKRVTIHDNRGICAHAGVCTSELPRVWRMKKEPWIDPDAVDVQEIVATIERCPSGALGYSIDGVGPREPVREPAIEVTEDGPYHVVGGVELADVRWGEGASKERYTLCRCGGSKNKPFCDGTHWSIEFRDDS